eukprot:7377103-Prymnesium_polylepis.2
MDTPPAKARLGNAGSGLSMAMGIGTARTVVFEGSCVARAAAPQARDGGSGCETTFSPKRRYHRKSAMLSPISNYAGLKCTVAGNGGSDWAL